MREEEKQRHLALRPRIFDPADGSYSVTEVKWNFVNQYNHLYWNGESGSLPRNNVLFLKLLYSVLGQVYGDWAEVTEENAENVWRVLCDHEKHNVRLLAGKKGTIPVIISQTPATSALIVDEIGENLELKKGIVFEGRELSPSNSLVVGKPPKFVVIMEGAYSDDWQHARSFTLAQVTGKVPSASASEAPRLLIPETGVSIFQNEHLKKLASKYTVVSLTPKITVPEILTPKPFVHIKNAGDQKIMVKVSDGTHDVSGNDYIIDEQVASTARQQTAKELSRVIPYIWPGQVYGGKISEEVLLNGIEAARFCGEEAEIIQAELKIPIVKDQDLPNYNL